MPCTDVPYFKYIMFKRTLKQNIHRHGYGSFGGLVMKKEIIHTKYALMINAELTHDPTTSVFGCICVRHKHTSSHLKHLWHACPVQGSCACHDLVAHTLCTVLGFVSILSLEAFLSQVSECHSVGKF